MPEIPKPEPENLTFRASAPAEDEPKVEDLPPASEEPSKNVFAEKIPFNPNLNEIEESETLLKFKKDQQYYQDLDITMDDLEKMEARIEEMEKYLGIENQNDLQYFIKNDIEKLDQKCIRLDDFVKVIEDKNFMLNDLYTKYEQLENFLKNGNRFTS